MDALNDQLQAHCSVLESELRSLQTVRQRFTEEFVERAARELFGTMRAPPAAIVEPLQQPQPNEEPEEANAQKQVEVDVVFEFSADVVVELLNPILPPPRRNWWQQIGDTWYTYKYIFYRQVVVIFWVHYIRSYLGPWAVPMLTTDILLMALMVAIGCLKNLPRRNAIIVVTEAEEVPEKKELMKDEGKPKPDAKSKATHKTKAAVIYKFASAWKKRRQLGRRRVAGRQ